MKRGFTLVELLAVIIIIAIISTITIPIVTDVVRNSKDTVGLNQNKTILNAAYDWSLKNSMYLPNENESISLTLGQLKQQGLVDVNLKDPQTKELYPNDLMVIITNTKEKNMDEYSYRFGDYVFSLDMNSGKNKIYDEYSPSIILKGSSTVYVDLGSEYEEKGYTAVSYDGIDITSNVTTQIIKDDDVIQEVSTDSFGIYYIHYTASNEKSSIDVVRSVIVTDISAPTLALLENETISSNISNYNLLDGVSCTDNSGTCNISTSGNLKLGTLGKYVITYTATDPSGNKVTKKKVITIK